MTSMSRSTKGCSVGLVGTVILVKGVSGKSVKYWTRKTEISTTTITNKIAPKYKITDIICFGWNPADHGGGGTVNIMSCHGQIRCWWEALFFGPLFSSACAFHPLVLGPSLWIFFHHELPRLNPVLGGKLCFSVHSALPVPSILWFRDRQFGFLWASLRRINSSCRPSICTVNKNLEKVIFVGFFCLAFFTSSLLPGRRAFKRKCMFEWNFITIHWLDPLCLLQ